MSHPVQILALACLLNMVVRTIPGRPQSPSHLQEQVPLLCVRIQADHAVPTQAYCAKVLGLSLVVKFRTLKCPQNKTDDSYHLSLR